MKIYLKLKSVPKVSKDLIPKIFNYVDGFQYKGSETYYDEKCKLLQCFGNRYRSLDEIMYIFKTYYPEITQEEVAFNLFSSKINNRRFQHGICGTIGRATSCYGKYSHGEIGTDYLDEKYQSIMSWNDLAKLVGITSENLKLKFIELFNNTSFEDYLVSEWKKEI